MTAEKVRTSRTVLVTGAAGFIGSALCRRLQSLGDEVVGYDNLTRGSRDFLPDDVRLVQGDIRDQAKLTETIAASKPDCVVHLAAMHFIPDCIARPQETIDVNIEGTRSLLDSCRNQDVQSFVFASSAAVYAPTDRPCKEDVTPLAPLEVYGESKLAAERLVATFQAETGVSSTILRLFNAIGRNETNPHVVPHIFESLRDADVVSLGNMAPCRDYVDTHDIADAIVAVTDRLEGLRTFNVGTGVAYSVEDIVELLRQILGRPIRVKQEPLRVRATERMLLVADIDNLRRATGWVPQLSLEDTLKDLAVAYGLNARPFSAR
jgi:UDP-glucose 4-epimerase